MASSLALSKACLAVVLVCLAVCQLTNARATRKQKPLIVAHRGASGYLPEHTFAAKTAAFYMGADYLEQDVVLTKDNVPIVLHDLYLDEVTNVAEIYPGRVRADKRFYAIEIKNPAFHKNEGRANFSEIVLDILTRHGYTKRTDACMLQTFDPFEARRIRQVLKNDLTMVQLLQSGKDGAIDYDGYWNTDRGLGEIAQFAEGIGPGKSQLVNWDPKNKVVAKTAMYHRAKELGLTLFPYTFRVDDLPEYAQGSHDRLLQIYLRDMKVDGIFTDFPDIAKDFLDASNASPKTTASLSVIVLCLLSVWKNL